MGNAKSLIYSKQEYLYYYIERSDFSKIRQMVNKNPELLTKPLTKDTKSTALIRACFNNNIQLVKMFLQELKADVNFVSLKGQTALSTAVKRGHEKLIRYLVQKGADVCHTATNGIKVIQYAILPGFYEITRYLYEKMPINEREQISDPEAYQVLGKQHIYRYVNYQMFMEGMVLGTLPEEMGDFLTKPKKKLNDPVCDPTQTWKQWFKRQMQFKDAPLVERNSLPEELQPQNRLQGKIHHYTNNWMSTHLSQKTILHPQKKEECAYFCVYSALSLTKQILGNPFQVQLIPWKKA